MRKLLLASLLLLLSTLPAQAAPDSIEGFSFGGSADEIVSRMGEPSSIDGPVYSKTSNVWVWSWDYDRYGALFQVEAETQDGNKLIRSVTIVPPSSWKTASGLGLGDSTDKILQVYPDVTRYQDSLWFARSSDKRNVVGFELTGSKIKSIFIGSMKP